MSIQISYSILVFVGIVHVPKRSCSLARECSSRLVCTVETLFAIRAGHSLRPKTWDPLAVRRREGANQLRVCASRKHAAFLSYDRLYPLFSITVGRVRSKGGNESGLEGVYLAIGSPLVVSRKRLQHDADDVVRLPVSRKRKSGNADSVQQSGA